MDLHWLPPEARHGKGILLEGEEAHHILKVRRHKLGDEIVFTDGEGHFLYAEIDRIDAHALHAVLLRSEDDPREEGVAPLTLALALLKGDHFELALEKCVELGVRRVIPLQAEHCVVRWKASSGERKLERWQRITIAAMKQSGRTLRPEILSPVTPLQLGEWIEAGTHWIVGDETEASRRVDALELDAVRPRLALIGPEGGFSERERSYFAEQGAAAVTLSPFRLRAETAAVVLVASLSQLSGSNS